MTVDYKIGLYARLRDPKYAAQYLAEAATDTDPEVFTLALQDVATAHRIIPDPAKSAVMTVYVLWESSSPASPSELVDIYATREAAETTKTGLAEICTCGHIRTHHSNTSGNCCDCECWEYRPLGYGALEIEEREVTA